MKRIVLISCASKKLQHQARAKELYISSLFQLSLAFAKELEPDEFYVLSAKYGLVDIDKMIEPYDLTLNHMSAKQKREWAKGVLDQLRVVANLEKDHFIILAGRNYRDNLIPHMNSYVVPLEGMRIGEQLHFLKRMVSS